MSNLIIGTAGHIDHGKTTLIKALTGIETDRLKEEKKRGITIDLGFAYFDLEDGRRAGIVDVPGHEKFIRNMLAGVSGIDLVLLVIAADEGIMPQTQEHLDILSILDVKKGIIVLTKCDLVDREWVDLVKEDIRNRIKDTFLNGAPIVEVSAIEGKGLLDLKDKIVEMTSEIEEKDIISPLRLPIDRIFTLSGFGTVVTGTLIEGVIRDKQSVHIYTDEMEGKVRSIQVHGKAVDKAYAGQRVAINITGVKKEDINRGDVLADINSMQSTMMIDVKINLLKNSNRILENWTRLRLYHGTREILCRLVLLSRDTLRPGESCFAQLRLEEKIACKYGDKFVIRFYSPLETIGGGVILDPNALKHKRLDNDVIEELKTKADGDKGQIVENILLKHSKDFIDTEYISLQIGIPKEITEQVLKELVQNEIIYSFADNIYIHRAYIDSKEEELINLLNKYHSKNPLKGGISKEEIKSKLFAGAKGKLFDQILSLYCNRNLIKVSDNLISLKDFEIELSDNQKRLKDDILKIYLNTDFKTPSRNEIINQLKLSALDIDIIDVLIEQGNLIKINDDLILHQKNYEKAKILLREHFKNHNEITLAEYRDLLDTSRKYVVPLLEHFDAIRLTKRVNDKRILF